LSINGKKEICDAFGGVLDRFQHHCLMVTGNTDDVVVKKDLGGTRPAVRRPHRQGA